MACTLLTPGILSGSEVLLLGCLVPIEDTSDEGRDEEGTGFGTGDGLDEGEHQSQVAIDAFLLENFCCLDSLPR